MLYNDVFTTIDKHPLFLTPSCRTTFRLLAHVSLLQYSRSSNLLAFRRTLANISAGYPCISFLWTQWVKNNNRPYYNQELKRVLAWPSSHYSKYPWSFFVFMQNLVGHDAVASLIYLCFICTLLFFMYKSKRYICLCNVGKCSRFRRIVKPSFAGFFLGWYSIWYYHLDRKSVV